MISELFFCLISCLILSLPVLDYSNVLCFLYVTKNIFKQTIGTFYGVLFMSNYDEWNPYTSKKWKIIGCFWLVILWMILPCLLMFCHVPVDIPPWFSAVSIALNSDVDLVSILIFVILFKYEQPRKLACILMFVAWNNFYSFGSNIFDFAFILILFSNIVTHCMR